MKGNRRGFTLIELSLSLVFISTLTLIIALLITNTVSSYRRGLTLKQINTVGMDIVDDMRSAIQNSSTKSVVSDCSTLFSDEDEIDDCEAKGGGDFVYVVRKATKIQLNAGTAITDVPTSGAFCTGAYSYVWNSGYYFMNNGEYPKVTGAVKLELVYGSGSGTTLKDFRLLKIHDTDRAVCIEANKNPTNKKIDVRSYGSDNPTDLLNSADEIGLALYDLTATTPASSAALNSLYYSVSFVLGTVQGGINIGASGNFCSAPNDYQNQYYDYCAINKFNFAARATGE